MDKKKKPEVRMDEVFLSRLEDADHAAQALTTYIQQQRRIFKALLNSRLGSFPAKSVFILATDMGVAYSEVHKHYGVDYEIKSMELTIPNQIIANRNATIFEQ